MHSLIPAELARRAGARFLRRRRGPAARRSVSRGFTLLEIVIVLTILLIMASLTWPPLLRYIRERALREQAHLVRVELNHARIHAIDYGLTYQFRFEPGGRRFVVIPLDRPDSGAAAAGSPSAAPAPTAPTASTATGPAVQVAVASGKLAEPCQFDIPKVRNLVTHADQAVVTEKLPEEWLVLLPDGNSLREASWAPPVRFFSDGSADDATIVVIDDQDRRIEITVRGLTGSVSTGPLERERPL